MDKRQLGQTDMQVTRLGFGLSEIGSADLSDSHPEEVLNAALDAGINFLDTAACYGLSEELIGQSVSQRRSEFYLATKAGHVVDGYEGEEWTAQTIRDSIDRSLKRLKTDWLDLVQLHSCGVAVLERTDESLQVTYNGQPLYYSQQDAGSGQMSGQGMEAFGGVWYVVSPKGILVGDEPSTDAALGDENLQELMTAGEEIFVDSCSVCHLRGTGPVLEGNQKLENIEYVVSTILNGRANGAMPAWGNVLSDDQIAAVATYIRNHGENAFGPVAPEQVQLRRQGH